MNQYQTLIKKIIVNNASDEGVQFNRETRSGDTCAIFGEHLEFDLRKGFPMVTTKKVPFKAVVGELLWFLNGENTLSQLRHRTDLPDSAWTIWTQDCERWNKGWGNPESDDLGNVYGVQWRKWYNAQEDVYVDQIKNLVEGIKSDPNSRYHLVSAWNVGDIATDSMALPPCHYAFQVFIDGDYMDLKWEQRSVDVFLGLPFNIASYALLLVMLARATGYRPRFLKASLGDVHLYEKHFDQAVELLERKPYPLPTGVKLPTVQDKGNFFEYIDSTAKEFALVDYVHHPEIKAPLLVGDEEGRTHGNGVNPPDRVDK